MFFKRGKIGYVLQIVHCTHEYKEIFKKSCPLGSPIYMYNDFETKYE